MAALWTVYGDHITPKSSFYEWYKLFKEGRDDCNEASNSGCPDGVCNTISQGKVEQTLKDDRRLLV